MAELKREGWAEADRQKTQDKLRKFIAILRDKKSRGQQFQKEHTDLSGKLTETSSDLDETRRRLELRLQLQEKSKLLERNPHPFESIGIDRFTLEIKTAWGRLTGFFKADYWTQQWHNFHRSGGMTQSIFFILFLSALITRKKIREFVQSIEAPAGRVCPIKTTIGPDAAAAFFPVDMGDHFVVALRLVEASAR